MFGCIFFGGTRFCDFLGETNWGGCSEMFLNIRGPFKWRGPCKYQPAVCQVVKLQFSLVLKFGTTEQLLSEIFPAHQTAMGSFKPPLDWPSGNYHDPPPKKREKKRHTLSTPKTKKPPPNPQKTNGETNPREILAPWGWAPAWRRPPWPWPARSPR